MEVDRSKEVQLGLTRAVVIALPSLPMSEHRLGSTLVKAVNYFGRTVDGDTPVKDLCLPSWHHFHSLEEWESPLYPLAIQLPERLVTSWNQGITILVVRFLRTGSQDAFLLDDLRARRDLIRGVTREYQKSALVRAAFRIGY